MDLVRSSETKYEEYERLLLERDQLLKDAESIWICYTKTFGQMIADVFEEKLECIRLKKTISYYQAALNHGGVVNPAEMEAYLSREMAAYQAELERMLEEQKRCGEAGTSSAYEVKRAKQLYRRLAKRIHPDINPETDKQEALQELWLRILAAYRQNDVKALSELEVLVSKALEELGIGKICVEIPDIEEKVEALKDEILEIRGTEPYTYGELLEDASAVEKKKNELAEELESYRKYRQELEDVIREMLESGGIRFRWIMK